MTKKSNIEIATVAELYAAMRDRGLCINEADFSMTWFGLSDSYYRLTGEATNVSALFNCWDRLQACGQFALAAECFKLVRLRSRVNARSENARLRARIVKEADTQVCA